MDPEQSTDSAPSITSRLVALMTPEAAPEAVETGEDTLSGADTLEGADTQEGAEADDGTEELDLDGLVLRVPKEAKAKISEWKEGALRRDDYTRKTQELADLHRQAQITAEALQQRQKFEDEISPDKAELSKITADLERYKQVDWGSLEVGDYIKLKSQMDNLKDRAKELHDTISGKAQKATAAMEEHRRKLASEGQKYLQKAIPGWGKDAAELAITSAKSAGYTDGELENVYDPRFVSLAWKAAQFDKLQGSKSAAVASVQKAPPVVKPGAGMGPGAAVENKYRDTRAQLRKSGSVHDAARLLMLRGNK